MADEHGAVDVQGTAIGVGTVAALVLFAYGRYIGGSVLGLDPAALALVAFALTAASLAVLHASYGRRDFAGAYALAAAGLFLVAPAAAPLFTIAGYLLLVAGGAYVAVATVRARREPTEGDRA
ncbi:MULTISPECIES: hypothetical protein [Saliphagus]|uniref:SPW repeat-containing protein n=1 Tax=Saliphagus infecundisoli TaxID=1849069 RepID=A0ABD5QH40_9EURY|nr:MULTISPECIES: hypothetical protein [Saliphagus]